MALAWKLITFLVWLFSSFDKALWAIAEKNGMSAEEAKKFAACAAAAAVIKEFSTEIS